MRHFIAVSIALVGIVHATFSATPPPRQLIFQSNNNVWWGTEFGLSRFQSENELWSNIRPEAINDVCVDEKTVWLGTQNGVLFADLRYLDWKGYTAKDGLSSDSIVRIMSDLDYVYVASTHGLARFNKLVEQWELIGDFADKQIYDMYSNQTQLWVATDKGVFYFDKKFEKWESYSVKTGLISNTVYRLFYFSEYIWALTDKGFSRYSSVMKTWNSYPLNDGALGSEVNFLFSDASFIWVVCPERVARFSGKNQTWENFSKNMPIDKKLVYGVSTSGTTSWFATSDGVYSFNEDQRRWKTYTAVDGLTDDVQEQIYTTGQTTLCKKGTAFSYLRPAEDAWYSTEIKLSSKNNGVKPKFKGHLDETGLGITTPGGESVNILGRAYFKVKNKADFPEPFEKSISNYISNKDLDSLAIDTVRTTRGQDSIGIKKIPRYKDFLYGWAKAQLNLNADLNNGRTIRSTYDNTDPLGDLRYSTEFRGFGEDNLRRIGYRTDQKSDYFYSTLINPSYLEGAGVRTEFGDRVGEKKLRRVNTGVWAGWGKTLYLDTLVMFSEDNFYDLGIRNIMTESVVIKIDGRVIDPDQYSIERTIGLLTFKNEGIANPDSRIEIACEYQPQIGEFTNQMVSAENVAVINNKVAIGVNGAYRGVKQPDRIGIGLDTNSAYIGSVNSKVELKSQDSKFFLRAIPEFSGSYNDSIFYKKQGSAGRLGLYSVAHNLKLKASGTYQSQDYVTLANQHSVFGRVNQQAEGEAVYDIWQQYMPLTLGASMVNASVGSESRQYAQYLLSLPNLPSFRVFGMRQDMSNLSKNLHQNIPRDSLKTNRLNGVVETQWDLPETYRSMLHLDRLWFNASYTVNFLTDTINNNSFDSTLNKDSILQTADLKFNQNIFAWVRIAPHKKIQLEAKYIHRIFMENDTIGNLSYIGKRVRPEFKLFSQEFIPGITLYSQYLFDISEIIPSSNMSITGNQNQLNSSFLVVPGVYWNLLNPFQLNCGYNFTTQDSVYTSDAATIYEIKTKTLDAFNQSFSIKPMLDFSEDLHFASRTEISDAKNLQENTQNAVKIYNESRLAFWERKTRLDFDYNIFMITNYMRDTINPQENQIDTLVRNNSYEVRFKWTERWMPNFRTEFPIGFGQTKSDTLFSDTVHTNQGLEAIAANPNYSSGNLFSLTPGILFDWRHQGKTFREIRVQYYIGALLANGNLKSYASFDHGQENKLDIQVKAGNNFFFRLLLNVTYMIDKKLLKYDMSELKATALF